MSDEIHADRLYHREDEIETKLGDLIADGRITDEDADIVRQFAAFLVDPEIGPPLSRMIPMSALRRHRDFLGLTDADLERAQAARDRKHAEFHQHSLLQTPSPLCTTCTPPETKTVQSTQIQACPIRSLAASHYRADGTCLCTTTEGKTDALG